MRKISRDKKKKEKKGGTDSAGLNIKWGLVQGKTNWRGNLRRGFLEKIKVAGYSTN